MKPLYHRSFPPAPAPAALVVLLALLAFAVTACGRPVPHVFVDVAVSGAHRAELPVPADALAASARGGGYTVLAGDLHCHVMPPDRYPHVSRTPAETVALAREEGLDFVVLTPHLRAGFFQDEVRRADAVKHLRALKQAVAEALGAPGSSSGGATTAGEAGETRAGREKGARRDPLFITGFEYTDFTYGHLGASFADLEEVLAAVPVAETLAQPGRFFEEYVKRGGFLVINHPLLVPLDTIVPWARYDMSWQPFTGRREVPYPDEIMVATHLAHGIEVFNLAVSEMRDRLMLFDRHYTLRQALRLVDWQVLLRPRRFVPVGGSDSHSDHLRATTFVLAKARTPEGIREALLAGRVCVRDPAACSLEVRAAGSDAWLPVGSALVGVRALVARTRGEEARILVNGEEVAPEGPGREVTIPLDPTRCAVIRAEVDGGYSAPVYVNCAGV
ncbi:hypothetical protein [Chondromyces apiculatus]|uniref:Uncharacterized protein n=1 Tax=Chondromyces apiculatus DSM 436 TaxID=1192034 RepID=A0A017SU09_9BACT|nr:hypothetical protein [Chondromyces apiculatus]EYF00473.1 Hypothetical protein CAP_0563 [Chondromyces apiculatus DSM 436]